MNNYQKKAKKLSAIVSKPQRTRAIRQALDEARSEGRADGEYRTREADRLVALGLVRKLKGVAEREAAMRIYKLISKKGYETG